MNIETTSGVKIIPLFRILPAAGKVELTGLDFTLGRDPEKLGTHHRVRVDNFSAFGEVTEDRFGNSFGVQIIERGGLPKNDELDFSSIPLDQIRGVTGWYTQLDDKGNRHPSRLVAICLD